MTITPQIISSIASKFMGTSKDISNAAFDYLKTRSVNSYKTLEVHLKAFGFTVEQFFNALADNTSDIEHSNSFREVSSLKIQEQIIENSEELSDAEKIDALNDLYEKQVEQQDRAEAERRRKRGDITKGILAAGATIAVTGTVVATKGKLPINGKAGAQIAQNAAKSLLKLPLK